MSRRLALLALGWGLLPALPALLRGELLGHPYTDLYPSVWSLWAAAQRFPELPEHTALLGHPAGMGWYAPSPIKGALGAALIPLLGLPAAWNTLVLAARVATVALSGAAARAWGASAEGALLAAALFGCAPFFQGFAVEGIIEGTDGWTLALWALCVGQRRPLASALALALTILSSWYLGLAACLLAALAALADRRALWSFAGLLLVAPAILRFQAAFPAQNPLPDAIRAMMGATLTLPTPGSLPGLHPFAMTAYIGFVAIGLLAWRRPKEGLLALLPGLLSLGAGPWYALPVLRMMRFPYRWHAATLALLALGLARKAPARGAGLLALALVAEGLLLSPIEPILPGASAAIPPLYAQAEGPLLAIPGPLSRPPGQMNPGRPRSRYLLYFQTAHGQPSPWVPDFNSVGVAAVEAPYLSTFRSYDPEEGDSPEPITAETLAALRKDNIHTLIIEAAPLGKARAAALIAALTQAGLVVDGTDGERTRLRLPG